MLFRFLTPSDVKSGDITPPDIYRARRRFMQAGARLGLGAATLATLGPAALSLPAARAAGREAALRPLAPVIQDNAYAIAERPTSFKAVTTYNNFYEFGTGKEDPAENAHSLRPRPWTVTVDGHVEKPGDYDIDDLIRPHDLRERVYRMRCVEGWSMVIPWVGIPLGEMIRRLGPTAKARYVRFETLIDTEQMPGQKRRVIDWPYVEGLRLDEAMHPLTLMAVGLYGKELPNQNGAPLRLVVPWKYGFKGIKSIVRISFTDRMPHNSWNRLAPHEYGFYANVNPAVAHPRWSQATERRIGEFRRRDTLMFNGYADEVAHLYAGMDLKKHF